MANSFFDCFKQEMLGDAAGPGHGPVDFEADNIVCSLMDSADYTVATTTDQDQVDLTDLGIVATSGTLAGGAVTMSGGTATVDFTDFTFSTVTGDQSELLVFYKNSGSDATSLLILVMDTFASGMPVTPNGGDIDVAFHASGLFTL